MKRIRRLIGGVLAVLVLGLVVGAAYQSWAIRRERAQLQATGALIDVGGGRRLRFICMGEGAPTVVFEPSSGGGASSASIARTEISRRTRVCSYDRMSTHGSDQGPPVVSVGMLANDLEALLKAARIQPPYILVPASIGGIVSELFARRHPDQVKGIVFLDAANSDQLAFLAAKTGWATRALGTALICTPMVAPTATHCGMARAFDQTMRDFAAAPPLRADLPMIVLSADTNKNLAPPMLAPLVPFLGSLLRERVRLHQEFSKRSTKGTWRLVPGSDHLIGNSRPQEVIDAVLEILKMGRT